MKKVYVALMLFQGIVEVIEVFEDEKESEAYLLNQAQKDGYNFKTYNELVYYMQSDASLGEKFEYMLFETEMIKKQGRGNK